MARKRPTLDRYLTTGGIVPLAASISLFWTFSFGLPLFGLVKLAAKNGLETSNAPAILSWMVLTSIVSFATVFATGTEFKLDRDLKAFRIHQGISRSFFPLDEIAYLSKEAIPPFRHPYRHVLRSFGNQYIVVAVGHDGRVQPVWLGYNPDWATLAVTQISQLTGLKILPDHLHIRNQSEKKGQSSTRPPNSKPTT